MYFSFIQPPSVIDSGINSGGIDSGINSGGNIVAFRISVIGCGSGVG